MELNFDSREYLKGNIKPFRVGVFGSRSLRDERVLTIILEKLKELNATCVISCQEPQGVSEVAQRVAKNYGYPLQLHFLNMMYLRGAFEQRSKEIISESDYLIVIHDGTSKGTENELKLVKKSNKPYHYEVLEKSQYTRSVGFNIKKDWGEQGEDGDDDGKWDSPVLEW
jgi:poly-D-alanine transfer protein DltD